MTAAYYQSPHPVPDLDPAAAIIDALAAARRRVLFAVYAFTHQAIAEALIAAHQRGVTVSGVVDPSALHPATTRVPALVAAGIDVRVWGSSWRLMHDKVLITDPTTSRATVALGSFNWTTQAETSNIEVLLLCRGRNVTRRLAPALAVQVAAAHDAGKPLA